MTISRLGTILVAGLFGLSCMPEQCKESYSSSDKNKSVTVCVTKKVKNANKIAVEFKITDRNAKIENVNLRISVVSSSGYMQVETPYKRVSSGIMRIELPKNKTNQALKILKNGGQFVLWFSVKKDGGWGDAIVRIGK
ncbi:hypothetical protein OAR19_00285 [bacterium]|nr:hypothetical protein [bacterium]